MSDFFDDMLSAMKEEADRVCSDNKQNDFLDKFVRLPREDGSLAVRLLPPVHGAKLPFQATRLHKLNGKNYHCRKELVGGRWQGGPKVCPVCDLYAHLWKKIEAMGGRDAPAAQELVAKARGLKPKERYYYNGVVRDDPSQTGVKIYSCPMTSHKLIIKAFVGDPKLPSIKPLGNVCDPTKGRDFLIVVEMQDKFPNYSRSQFLDPSPLGTEEQIQKYLENAHDLSELRQVKSYEELDHILKVHLNLVQDDSTDFSEYDSTSVSMATGAPKRDTKPTPEAPKQESKVESPPFDVDSSDDDGDEVLADDEFLKELQNL